MWTVSSKRITQKFLHCLPTTANEHNANLSIWHSFVFSYLLEVAQIARKWLKADDVKTLTYESMIELWEILSKRYDEYLLNKDNRKLHSTLDKSLSPSYEYARNTVQTAEAIMIFQ